MAHRWLPSLSALRAFEAAARHESAKQAAEELNVTATAISHQIRSLEESLGVALFLRKPRQLALTVQGRELQQTLETAFDSISATVERLSAGALPPGDHAYHHAGHRRALAGALGLHAA